MQAGAERALNRLMTALAGASVLFGQGMLETGITFDIPTLLVDDEVVDYVLRMLAGFKVDAANLCTDMIKEVGPFGTYLAEIDTMENLGMLSTYNLMNRENYDMWVRSGKPDIYEQARERAKHILAVHKQKNPLSPEKVNAIRKILIEAEEELGVADFWKNVLLTIIFIKSIYRIIRVPFIRTLIIQKNAWTLVIVIIPNGYEY